MSCYPQSIRASTGAESRKKPRWVLPSFPPCRDAGRQRLEVRQDGACVAPSTTHRQRCPRPILHFCHLCHLAGHHGHPHVHRQRGKARKSLSLSLQHRGPTQMSQACLISLSRKKLKPEMERTSSRNSGPTQQQHSQTLLRVLSRLLSSARRSGAGYVLPYSLFLLILIPWDTGEENIYDCPQALQRVWTDVLTRAWG